MFKICGNRVIVIPQAEDTVLSNRKILDSLICENFRDYLRIKIATESSRIPELVEANKLDEIKVMAGVIKAYRYLLDTDGAILEVTERINAKQKTENDGMDKTIGRFSSRIEGGEDGE